MLRNIGDITVATYLDEKRKNVVKIRVQYKGKSRYFSTRERLSPKEYSKFLNGTLENSQITDIFDRMVANIKYLGSIEEFSFIRLKALMSIGKESSLQNLIEDKIAELLSFKKLSTAQVYTDLLSSIYVFTGNKTTPIAEVNSDFVKDYVDFLVKVKKNGRTTVSIRLRSLSHILNTAVKNFLLKKNPLINFKIPRYERRHLNISEESLKKLLHSVKEDIGERCFYWLQFWRLQYYCNGLNLIDLLHIKTDALSVVSDEITVVRHKTEDSYGAVVHIPIIPEINEAFSYIGRGKVYLIPLLDELKADSIEERKRIQQITKNINSNLKKICKILKINEHVTTYTARHTFATRLLRSGVPIEFISQSLGHSNVRTTQEYLGGYTPSQRRSAAEFLKVK